MSAAAAAAAHNDVKLWLGGWPDPHADKQRQRAAPPPKRSGLTVTLSDIACHVLDTHVEPSLLKWHPRHPMTWRAVSPRLPGPFALHVIHTHLEPSNLESSATL
jgi:hypothetical protein